MIDLIKTPRFAAAFAIGYFLGMVFLRKPTIDDAPVYIYPASDTLH